VRGPAVIVALAFASGGCGRLHFDPRDDAAAPDAFVVPRSLDDRSVAGGSRYTCALVGGTPWCWGVNNHGQLGRGTIGGSNNVPMPIQGVTDAVSIRATCMTCRTVGNTRACSTPTRR
jgi:hypothetical protein